MSTLSNIEFDYVSTEDIPKALTIEQEGTPIWSRPFPKAHKVVRQGYPPDEAGTENSFKYIFALINLPQYLMHCSDYDSLRLEICSLVSTLNSPNSGRERSSALCVLLSLQQNPWHMSPCLPMFPVLLPSAFILFVSQRPTNAKGSASHYWRSISIVWRAGVSKEQSIVASCSSHTKSWDLSMN